MNKNFKYITSFALIFAFIFSLTKVSVNAQVRAEYDWGAIGLGQQIKRLQTTASGLHTGAHPDDEDSGLMAYLARAEHARIAYLSLNRGEGGQNVIGPEIFESLGIIRAEELLQARRLDGGEQFFTRVMDYGFSKQRSEAARIWDDKVVLGDMVRVIRLYRPLVLMARFTGTPLDGHGQHQLSGYLTPLAFKAAADPNQYPEHFAEGLRPWQVKKLYVGSLMFGNDVEPATVVLNTGKIDPVIGRTYFQVAMQGLSQHKSQGAGSLELQDKQSSGLRLLDSKVGKVENEKSVFDGIDTSIKGIAKITENSEAPLNKKLAELQAIAEKALAEYNLYNPQAIVPILAQGVKVAREAEQSTKNPDTKFFLKHKENEFAKALQNAAGIVVDSLADSETIVAGNSTLVAVRVFGDNVKVKNVSLDVPKDWKIEGATEPALDPNAFRASSEVSKGTAHSTFYKLSAPANASLTQPYWLAKPRNNYNFDWSAPEAEKNAPFQTPFANAIVKLEIGGEEVTVVNPVQYRYRTSSSGEIRRFLNVVPAVLVEVNSDLMIAPASANSQKRQVVMSVVNNSARPTKGTAKLDLPNGWTSSPASAEFDLKSNGEKTSVAFEVTIPANAKVDAYKITANAVANGQTYNQTVHEIAYPHIQTHRFYTKSEVLAQVLDLKVANVNVGYIMGTGDTVPEAIKLMGLPVTLLEEKDLSSGDLSKFDTIVVGIRASQVRNDFAANNARLMDYVRNGGTLITQYQQGVYLQKNLAPFPAKMQSTVRGVSNVRVTDENAPVKILVPNHSVFNFPNKIVNSDWDNWVQERNLYCFSEFDSNYTPLLESHDEGDPENSGGMVYAEIGKGKYVYTSYSWFRQLPTGNPGAYRVFANLLSLGSKK